MTPTSTLNPLKQILENIRFPESLDAHPWVEYRFVREAVAETPELAQKSAGYQLVAAVSNQFLKMMPNTPPRQGKRLDTRWGKFGILAAQYFAPFRFGTPYPSSLQDAWGRIDQAILLFVFGKTTDHLSANDVFIYKLVGDETGVAARSTISDWHINGCEQLADLILGYEQHLASLPPVSPGLSAPGSDRNPVSSELQVENGFPNKAPRDRHFKRWLTWFVLLVLVAALIFAGAKAWRAYRLVVALQGDVTQLKGLISVSTAPDIAEIKQVGPLLDKFRQDVLLLNQEVYGSLRIVGPALAWIPGYGPDLQASPDLLEMTDKISASAQTVYQTTYPILEQFQATDLTVTDLTKTC